MRVRLVVRVTALLAGLGVALAGCGGGTSDDGRAVAPGANGTVVIASPLEAENGFDPHENNNGHMYQYIGPLYDSLLRRTADFQLEPSLATEWAYVDDEKVTLELALRTGVTFADGAAFDAEAVKANIEHGKAATGPATPALTPVESAEVVDAQTVRLHLSGPSPTLLNDLSGMIGMMISPTALADGTDLATTPAGSGAYTLSDETVPGDRYVYEARPDYWNPEAFGPQRLEIVVMVDGDARLNALRSGEADLAMVTPEQVSDAESASLTIKSAPVDFWGFSLADRAGEKAPALGDRRVRQALNFAIDREALVDAIGFGYGVPYSQIFPPDSLGDSPEAAEFYDYDPEHAKQLLAEAGFADGFSFTAVGASDFRTYAEAVQGMLAEVGVDMQLTLLDTGLVTEWSTTNYSAAHFLFGVETEFNALTSFGLADSPFNPFGIENGRLGQIAAELRTVPEAEAGPLYQEASEIITEEGWFVVTHFTENVWAINEDRVQGVEMYARNAAPFVYGWDVSS